MNCIKSQKDMTPKDELSREDSVQYVTGEEWKQLLRAPERKKLVGLSRNHAQLWMCLVMKIKSGAVRNNIA